MKTLFIFDANVKTDKSLVKIFGPGDKVYFFALTSKHSALRDLAGRVKDTGTEVETLESAREISLAADRLRKKYIDFTANIAKENLQKNKNLKEFFRIDKYATLWWLSIISEKNPFKSEGFNILAQLDSVIEVIKREGIEKIVFACVNGKLRNALEKYSRERRVEFFILPAKKTKSVKKRIRASQRFLYAKHLLHLLNTAAIFFAKTRKIKRKLGASRRLLLQNDPLLVITYYPNIDVQFAQAGTFRNKYYDHLQEALEKDRRHIIWIAIYVENNYMSFGKSLDYAKSFIENGHNIFFAEEFNSGLIQIKSLLGMLVSGIKFLMVERFIAKKCTFGEYNFYTIFKDDWYSSFAGSTGFTGLLYYNIFKSILKKFKTRKCLYYCEMQAWEKALSSACRAVGSKTALLGYQHSVVSPMYLNYFNSPDEIKEDTSYPIPQPDKIVCNGRLSYGRILESGWPVEKVYIAEALRYKHLKGCMNSKKNKRENVVLLAFSLNPEESSSLLSITYEALKGSTGDIKVWVKPHPFSKVDKVFEISGISRGTSRFSVRDEPVENLLAEAKAIIVGGSSVSMQAAAFNCKVITVNVPEWVNMSPLKNMSEEIARTVSSSGELKKAISDALEEKSNFLTADKRSEKITGEFFNLEWESDAPRKFMELLK